MNMWTGLQNQSSEGFEILSGNIKLTVSSNDGVCLTKKFGFVDYYKTDPVIRRGDKEYKNLINFPMTDQIKKHVIAILVDNEFGALARIVELFSARGYNIETLNVAPTSLDKKLSRVTITTYGTVKTVDLICKLLKRIVPVHTAAELTREHGYIERELALVQIIADEQKREEAMKIVDKYRTNIVDIAGDSIVFEVIGNGENIDELLAKLVDFGLASVSRTGIAAGFKGEKKLANV